MRILVISALLCALAGTAAAQYAPQPQYGPGYYPQPPPPPQGIQRGGLVIGGAIGLGAIGFADCQDCDGLGGLALEFQIGGMVAPNVAIVFDGSTVIHPLEDESGTLSSNVGLGAIRVWLTPQLWLSGGIGIGVLELQDDWGYIEARTESGLAGMAAVGVELLQTYNFALDLQVRITGSRIDYDDDPDTTDGIVNVGVLLGFNWY